MRVNLGVSVMIKHTVNMIVFLKGQCDNPKMRAGIVYMENQAAFLITMLSMFFGGLF